MTIDETIEVLKNCGYLTNREEKQIAEWLELLKWYEQGMEDIPCESGVLPKDVYWAGYNKAIDDLMEKASECSISDADWHYLGQVAKQLKAGAGNGTDNQ